MNLRQSLALTVSVLCTCFTLNTYARSDAQPSATMPEITIYHLEGRRSERIVWLMEELELPYTLEFVRGDLNASMNKIREINPAMPVAPTVTVGDKVMMESGAIIELIINRYAPGQLHPDISTDAYGDYLMWMHYAEGSLAARLFTDYRAWRIQPPTKRSRLVDSEAVVQFAENYLAKHQWFGGDEFSAADIMMVFPLNVATSLELVDAAQFPHIAKWKAAIEKRPAYQRMLAKARPDGLIGALPKVKQRPPSSRE